MQQRRWLKANVKAKSDITLTLADSLLAQVSTLVDNDDKTAKELWDELDEGYRMPNTKLVINIQRQLDTMKFDKDEDWDKHVESFHRLVENLESYDKPFSAEDRVSKLLRTFLGQFPPTAMVTKSSGLTFEKDIVSVKADIARRKTSGRTKNVPLIAASAEKGRRKLTNNDPVEFENQRKTSVIFLGSQVIMLTNVGIVIMDDVVHEEVSEEEVVDSSVVVGAENSKTAQPITINKVRRIIRARCLTNLGHPTRS